MGRLVDTRPDRQMRSAALAPEYFALGGKEREFEYTKLCRVRLKDGTITYRWRQVIATAIDIGRAGGEL